MVGLDAVEKLFWSALDFIVLRPRRFRQAREATPSRYMEPIPFAVSVVVLYQIVLVGAVRFLSPLVEWSSVTGMPIKMPDIPDASALFVVSAPYGLFSFFGFAGLLMLGARLTGQRLKINDTLVAMCYSCATFLFLVAYIGLSTFTVYLVSTMSGQATQIAALLYSGFQFVNLLLLPYFVASAAAFGGIKFGRLFLGTVLAIIVVFVILLFVVFVVTVLVGVASRR